ncbi:polyphosphate:nucleotide phosphotransferase, PPK2 family [Micrococcus terreus]|uniref:Polyphosphate:nucleotide phosphotransferase, PPK2 family n=2 Tax=Micrococcaceae TaxID=1268 RepID=A0A1I7MEA5_9MICC|nr:polyphosphate:nucleotide phosphotransferase, PPK2 family [Micrococcus terreus]
MSAKRLVMDPPQNAAALLRARTADGALLGPQDVDPDTKPGYGGGKAEGQATLAARATQLADLQELLYANGRAETGQDHSLLLVVQAMDTAGKGGILRHVAGAMDPQGVRDVAFKKPTAEELEHDFLWRIRKHVPEPGMVGVFDRSHYEDVLVHRVRELTPLPEIEQRYQAIRDFEQELADAGTRIIKVMLHISQDEQKERLTERLERPDKHWKYNPGDVDERALWDEYMEAYRIAVAETDADHAPWYIVPANRKWYSRMAVQELLIEALSAMDLSWPVADFDVEAEKRRLAAS